MSEFDVPLVHDENPGEGDETRLLPLDEYTFTRFRLLVTDGPDKSKSATSEGPEFVIGTSKGNDLVLCDPAVSRHHCSISHTSRGPLLRDLGSTNGTRLSGHRIESVYLKHESLIELGVTALRFQNLNEVVHEPLGVAAKFGRVLG